MRGEVRPSLIAISLTVSATKRILSVGLTISLLLFAIASTRAATGVFGSYVAIDPDGPGGTGYTFYGAQQPGPSYLAAFNGLDLGDFTEGSIAQIAGGELLTYKNSGGDVTGAELRWRVNPGGSFSAISLGWTADAPFADAASNGFSNSGDQKWSNIASTPNFLSGLTPGSYTLEVYFRAFSNEGDRLSDNSGANYIANFDVVAIPEPSSLALAGIAGGVLLLFRRKRSNQFGFEKKARNPSAPFLLGSSSKKFRLRATRSPDRAAVSWSRLCQ